MKKRVLICDDDEGISEVTRIILEENGYDTKLCNTGKAIQKKVKEYQPDLILLDLWMPGIDGKETTKLLKTNPETRHIPIIIVSALNEIQGIAKAIGADGFISKPFEIKDLIAKVEETIK
jgi:CheY-like chemotaxis protein